MKCAEPKCEIRAMVILYFSNLRCKLSQFYVNRKVYASKADNVHTYFIVLQPCTVKFFLYLAKQDRDENGPQGSTIKKTRQVQRKCLKNMSFKPKKLLKKQTRLNSGSTQMNKQNFPAKFGSLL